MYAIERVQRHVYSLCKLAWWLKEKDVEDLWDPENSSMYPRLPLKRKAVDESEEWWHRAAVKTETEDATKGRVSMSMLRLPTKRIKLEPQPEATEPLGNELDSIPAEMDQQAPSVPEVPLETMEAPSPQQLLETLVNQYLDAVYMAKTSLAYFAKGPIARVRNAFTSPEEGAPPTYELVSFMRSMILNHKSGDKKYQDKLPEIIRNIPPGSISDDEVLKPKKSKNKLRLSRDGVYPIEEETVRKWWLSEPRASEHGEETLEQRIKRRIADLRVREALAQMILMLEIIALESLSTYKAPEAPETQAAGDAETQGETQVTQPKKRKKKMEDIGVLLDLLLDKLCIWQSVDHEAILDFGDKSIKHEGDVGSKTSNGDRLQGFCVEVLIPFYMGRLPEQTRMISKKLGGPVQTTPPKRKAMRPPVASRKSGGPKEPISKKTRRSLSRVVTDTAAQVTRPRTATPSLHRSATDTSILGIKREASEVPLSAIPFQRSPSAAARQSLSHLKHLQGRQIDLGAPSAATAAKLRQKKRVEEDLQEAIKALKKPNRGLAAGSYVDDIERRGIGSASRSRKPTTTVRKLQKDVQVSATPRVGKRTTNVIESTPVHQRNPFVREDAEEIPSLNRFCIPSSTIKPAAAPGSMLRVSSAPMLAETPTKLAPRRLFDAPKSPTGTIFATPAKRRGMSPPPFAYAHAHRRSPNAVLATPVKETPIAGPAVFATPLAVQGTPSKTASNPRRASRQEDVLPPPAPGFATTLKPASPARTNEATAEENEEAEVSIYDALGWNDEDDFL